MKYAGIGLVAVSVSMTGIFVSRLLRIRLSTVETVLLFISLLQNQLTFSLSALPDAVSCLKAYPSLYKLDFLSECVQHLSTGMDFPDAWHNALTESRLLLKKHERYYLVEMIDGLSQSDTDGQKRIFDYYRFYFNEIREKAAQSRKKYAGAATALGILLSALLAVILI